MPNPPRSGADTPEQTILADILRRVVRIETRQVKSMAVQGLNPDGSVRVETGKEPTDGTQENRINP